MGRQRDIQQECERQIKREREREREREGEERSSTRLIAVLSIEIIFISFPFSFMTI